MAVRATADETPTTEQPTTLDQVIVSGRAVDLVGVASTASQGSVGYIELGERPFLRRGELLEVIPGVVITQHSGGGKANQYFLRGFNLDHGTDFAISVEGMPVNLRTHGHGQGYADLNFIIPEFVQSVDYTKGPFSARNGDFSSAGAAAFNLFATLPHNFVTLEVGENNYDRFVVGDTFVAAKGSVTTVGFEATHDDGPWTLQEDLSRYSVIGRHSWNTGNAQDFAVTAMAYRAEWNSTDQVPLRALESRALGRFGNIDASDGGETERASVSLDWTRRDGSWTSHLNAYAVYYSLNLFSNFTYFLEDPAHGDQFNQRDRRAVFGMSFEERGHVHWFGHRSELLAGVQVRDDLVGDVALRLTEQRKFLRNVRSDDVRESSIGGFAQATTHWNKWLRSEAGLRGDLYRFDVDSDQPLNSGERNAAIASPKLGLVLGPWSKTELYLNAGFGFHSNDARGTTLRVDPTERTQPVDAANPLVRSRGAEAGVRTSSVPGLVSTLSFWALDLDSELVFVGDAGATEPSGASRRDGIEIANFYRPSAWLTLDADFAFTHARYRGADAADRIANSIGRVVTAGISVGRGEGVFATVRLRYFGEQPLTEDNSVTQPSSSTVNARVGWRNRDWEIAVSVLNVMDAENDDIAYFYTSRLPGEPAEGVDDVHLHTAEPRTARVTISRKF